MEKTNAVHVSRKLPVLIGLSIVILGVSLVLVQGGFFSKASDDRPSNVVVNPTSPNSATVTWSTGNNTQGQILYSNKMETFTTKTGGQLNANYAPEEQAAKEHSKQLTDLEAGSTYYFEIQVGDTIYDNDGVPYTFTTPSTDSVVPTSGSSSVIDSPTPTPANTLRTSVTPVQHLVIPSTSTVATPTTGVAGSCNYIDCNVIKQKFGQGCSTQDYLKCLRKNNSQQ